MDEIAETIRDTLRAAGCSDAEISGALHEYRTGDPNRLVRQLRKCRCRRMEELHESQRRVDRLDDLIRKTKQA